MIIRYLVNRMYKIYKIVDNTNGNIYIGITTGTLKERLRQHRIKTKNNTNNCVSRDIIKNNDYKIELIEETDDKTRERYWIENTECINKQIPGRTWKEWYKDNNEKNIEYKRKYRARDRPKYLEQQKRYSRYKRSWGHEGYTNCLWKIDSNLFFYDHF